MFCGFGIHLSKFDKIKFMKQNYPKLYNAWLNQFGFKKVFDYIGIKY